MESFSTPLSTSISSHHPTYRPPVFFFDGPNFRSHISIHFPQKPSFTCKFHRSSKPPSIGSSKTGYRNIHIRISSARSPSSRVQASNDRGSEASSSGYKLIALTSAITVILAVANRVLYKLALVPMRQYPFFLAQFTTFGQVLQSMLIFIFLPKSPFVAIGILEALGVALGMAAGAMLPGPAIPILSQTFLVWQLPFSTLLLGRRYSFNQIAGCFVVAVGVVVAVAWSDAGQMLSGIGFLWPAIMVASTAFQAGASIVKEFVFIDSANRLNGKALDIFVVNSFGSGFQALFVLLFLPFLSNLKGIPFTQLPSYLMSGAGCFLNIGANTLGCDGSPLLPLLYVATNLAFNISVLNVVKISSALVSSLIVMLSVPISIYVLSLPLPYLPQGTNLSPFFLTGSVILVLGLILYNIPRPAKQGSKID